MVDEQVSDVHSAEWDDHVQNASSAACLTVSLWKFAIRHYSLTWKPCLGLHGLERSYARRIPCKSLAVRLFDRQITNNVQLSTWLSC
jgi:hypothetical protein